MKSFNFQRNPKKLSKTMELQVDFFVELFVRLSPRNQQDCERGEEDNSPRKYGCPQKHGSHKNTVAHKNTIAKIRLPTKTRFPQKYE